MLWRYMGLSDVAVCVNLLALFLGCVCLRFGFAVQVARGLCGGVCDVYEGLVEHLNAWVGAHFRH